MSNESCLYGREPELIALIPTRKKKFIELHHLYGLRRFGRIFLKQFFGIITITNALKEDVITRYSYPRAHIHVAPSGVDLNEFKNPESKEISRARLVLSKESMIALYIGSLEAWKGVGTFLNASHIVNERGISCVVIGGTEEQIESLRSQYPEVQFLGQRPQFELPHNQQIADILVVPNTAKEETSARHTSPLKVFAHMASGIPIVASRTEAISEVLNTKNAILVSPDDPQALAKGMWRAVEDTVHALLIAKQARVDVSRYTWESRTTGIVAFVSDYLRNPSNNNR